IQPGDRADVRSARQGNRPGEFRSQIGLAASRESRMMGGRIMAGARRPLIILPLIILSSIGSLVCLITLGCTRGSAPGTRLPRAGVDESPRIYVADWANHRLVRMHDMQGVNWTTYGDRDGDA